MALRCITRSRCSTIEYPNSGVDTWFSRSNSELVHFKLNMTCCVPSCDCSLGARCAFKTYHIDTMSIKCAFCLPVLWILQSMQYSFPELQMITGVPIRLVSEQRSRLLELTRYDRGHFSQREKSAQ